MSSRLAGHELVIHELPRQRGEVRAELVVRFLVEDLLVIGTHEATCVEILERLTGSRQDEVLQSLAAYRHIMDRVITEAGEAPPQMRWYLDPFDYAQVLRAASGGPKKRRKDMLAILKSEGFDAVQALGGFVHLATDDYEMLHRTKIYAPAVEGSGGEVSAGGPHVGVSQLRRMGMAQVGSPRPGDCHAIQLPDPAGVRVFQDAGRRRGG